MYRNKLKKLIVFLAVCLLMSINIVSFAEEAPEIVDDVNAAVTTNNDISTISNSEPAASILPVDGNSNTTSTPDNTSATEETSNSSNQQFAQGDQYIRGDNVVIDYVIDGNLFVIANNVTISSEIGGDAFILANNITLEEKGNIYSNLFAVTKSLDVKGSVYDIYAVASDNISFSNNAYIYRDFRAIASKEVSLAGTIGRNANIYGISKLKLPENANGTLIAGNLNYTAAEYTDVKRELVGGDINFNKVSTTTLSSSKLITIAISIASSLVLIAVVWLVLKWLSPKFVSESGNILKSNPLSVILSGLGLIILLPVLAVLLLLAFVTFKVTLAMFAIYFVLLALGTSLTTISLHSLLCEKLEKDGKGIQFLLLLAVGLVICVLSHIPYIGGIVSLIASILGIGTIIPYLRNRTKES